MAPVIQTSQDFVISQTLRCETLSSCGFYPDLSFYPKFLFYSQQLQFHFNIDYCQNKSQRLYNNCTKAGIVHADTNLNTDFTSVFKVLRQENALKQTLGNF